MEKKGQVMMPREFLIKVRQFLDKTYDVELDEEACKLWNELSQMLESKADRVAAHSSYSKGKNEL